MPSIWYDGRVINVPANELEALQSFVKDAANSGEFSWLMVDPNDPTWLLVGPGIPVRFDASANDFG